MSYHIKLNDYFCSKCNVEYIPYEEGILCPNCKTQAENIPEEYLGFIDELIGSMMVNKRTGGEFLPGGWLIASFADSIQSTIFEIFYAWDKNKPRDVELFIREFLNKYEFEKDNLYLRDYIISVALKVYARKEELHFSWWNRFWSELIKKVLP